MFNNGVKYILPNIIDMKSWLELKKKKKKKMIANDTEQWHKYSKNKNFVFYNFISQQNYIYTYIKY